MMDTDPDRSQRPWPDVRYWVQVGGAIIGIVVALGLILILKSVLLLVLASLVLAIGLQPLIEAATRRGIGRGPALALVLAGIGVPVVAALGFLIPTAAEQTQRVVDAIPDIRDEIARLGDFGAFIAERFDPAQLADESDEVTRTFASVASVGFNTFTVLVLTPYFAYAFPEMKRWLLRLLHRNDRPEALTLLNQSTSKISDYIVGNLTVSLIAGVVAAVALSLIGVESAIVLALWIALTDLIPIAGAFIGAIPAVAIAGLDGLGPAVAVAVVLLVYQLIENYLISPRVMRNAIDLSPPAVIVALMVGSTLAGVLGALMALPLAAMIKLVFEAYVLAPRIDKVRNSEKTNGQRIGRVRKLP